MKVIKRDGSIVDYDRSKINTAIQKANAEVPEEDRLSQDRIDAINQAVKDGYGVVVMAGYLFGPACYSVATQHPEVLFLSLIHI